MLRTYTELLKFQTIHDRFRYLSLNGRVGVDTFGFDRWMNQEFYASREWKRIRQHVIARDEGCDLAVPGFELNGRIYIHHMNPMTKSDLIHGNEDVLDPEFLISCSHTTHNAIHYGDEKQLPRPFVPRHSGDTRLW